MHALPPRMMIALVAVLFAQGDTLFVSIAQAEGIRSQAVVDFSFDEATGDALDAAVAGSVKDNGALVAQPQRINSPFWGQSGRRALVLDAGSGQRVQVADSADIDRPEAVSVSLFVVNLHPRSDGAFHGLFAKRDDTNTKISNYGINFTVASDNLQVYVNDGRGYKVANYSVAATIGYRQSAFVTAVYQLGDAPAPDADEVKDDVLIRFFVNGKAATPTGVVGGTVSGNEVWLLDVNPATLVNDAPLTIGSSMPGLEQTSCVVDEFSLFPRALAPDEVATLFAEVAGPKADEQRAIEQVPVPTLPEIAAVSLFGLQSGHTSVLTVTGTGLQPSPELVVPFLAHHLAARPGATAERVEFEVPVPADVAAGHYAVRVATPRGISGALTVAVDALPQIAYAEGFPEKPTGLPVAVSGILSGQQQHRIYFAGKTGQRVVIDLECKRIGSAMDPVLELRSPHGAPLSIAWGRPEYRGDTRIEAKLFGDGVYSVNLHDLAFNAPGQNPYRMKIGDLKLVDTVFPPAVAPGTSQTVAAIGPGIDPAAVLPVEMPNVYPGVARTVSLPTAIGAVGPAPAAVVGELVELLETSQPDGKIQSIDARFTQHAHLPVMISGRIGRPGETDRYQLDVTPGMTLSLSVESFGLRSPLDPQVLVLSASGGSVLAASEERPRLDFAVPAGVTSVLVALRDLNHRGGSDYIYRLKLIPAGQPDVSLVMEAARVDLPRDGTALVRVDVNRAGYTGPIALSLAGAHDLSIVPAEIPAGATKALLIVKGQNAEPTTDALIRSVQLTGQSVGLDPPLRRMVLTPFDARLALVPSERAHLTVSLLPAAGCRLALGELPSALFKGSEWSLPLTIQVSEPRLKSHAVRLTLLTTEAPRTKVDPADPTQQRRIELPLVRSLPEQTMAAGDAAGALRISVPLDVAEFALDCVVRAEFVPHAFSDKVFATVYSEPFRRSVETAVSARLETNVLSLKGKGETRISGTIKRTEGFDEPVDLLIVNLPAGYLAPKLTVEKGQERFELVVTAPEIAAAADIPNVQFRVTTSTGSLLQADTAVSTKVSPGP